MASWVARITWIIAAVIGGEAIDAATVDRTGAVRWAAGVGSWTIWGAVMLALAIPSVRSLTVGRVGAPLSLAVATGSAFSGASAADIASLALPSLVACAAIFTTDFGRHFVQSSSYGDEERLPLRMPVAAGTAAVLSWFVWSAALVAGPMLLAARSWAAGIVLTLLAAAGLVLLLPRWHRLSRRWLVLVPAGLVVHDPVVLADTLMLRTDQIGALRLAPPDTEAADLTGPASGYAIEVLATETITTVFAFTPSDPGGRAIHLTGFLVSPSRPGEALRAAAARGLNVT